MGEKIIATLSAAAVIAPLCAVCILGPVFFGSAVAWVSGWFGGFDIIVTSGLAVAAAGVAYGLVRWKRAKAAADDTVAAYVSRIADKGTR